MTDRPPPLQHPATKSYSAAIVPWHLIIVAIVGLSVGFLSMPVLFSLAGYPLVKSAQSVNTVTVSANCQDAAKPNNPAYWVSVTRSSALPRWQMTSCLWQDIDTSGGNHNLYVNAIDEHGANAVAYAFQAWPDPVDSPVKQLTLAGTTNFGLYGGSFDPQKGQVGAYSTYIEGTEVSDVVSGMGLPLNRHVNYIVTFQRVVSGVITPTPTFPTSTLTLTSTPGPTGTPAPTAVPGLYVTHAEFNNLIDLLIGALQKARLP